MLALLLPRRAIGRRGAVLSVVGAMWVLMGAGLILKGDPDSYAHLHLLVWCPAPIRAILWVATGALAIAWAFRPERIRPDAAAFTALVLMPAWRAVAYAGSWVVELAPGGLRGVDDGWRGAVLYGLIVGLLIIMAGWREPPRRCQGRP